MSDWGHTRWLEPSSHRGFSSFGQIGRCPRRLRPKVCQPLVTSVCRDAPARFQVERLEANSGDFWPLFGPPRSGDNRAESAP
jgi:hypothetical protein